MGVYNNDNGNIIPLATNLRTQSTTFENFVTQEELIESLATKQDVIQYETLPTASADNLGQIVQYIGATNASYTNGYFYKCVSDGAVDPTYSWEELYDFATKTELADGLATKQDVIQYSDMPDASASNLGKIYQYVGETDSQYINGITYKCVSDDAASPTYSWQMMNIPHFKTMPSDAILFSLPTDVTFETDGYWGAGDGCGGKYAMFPSAKLGGLAITYNGVTKYLLQYSVNGGAPGNEYDACRYGIRSFIPSASGSPIPSQTESYAISNSDIMSRINMNSSSSRFRTILKFRVGRYYFVNPISLGNRHINLMGVESNIGSGALSERYYVYGTTLCFPYLTNGQSAINLSQGCIDNINIVGNRETYNFNINRNNFPDNIPNVVNETIATDGSGNQIKCTGISTDSNGYIRNVTVNGFYIGINTGENRYLSNVYCSRCHIGILTRNDTQMVGVYGFNVHTLIQIDGSLASATQVRVDSCVNAIRITKGGNINIVNLDGDWCTNSLILFSGKSGSDCRNSNFTNIGGRCCTIVGVDSDASTGLDVNNLPSGTTIDQYGTIRVNDVKLYNCRFTFTGGGGGWSNVLDDDRKDSNNNVLLAKDKYKTPDILFTFTFAQSHNYTINNNIFEIAQLNDVSVRDDYLKKIQTKTNSKFRIDAATNTYFIDGNVITEPTLS